MSLALDIIYAAHARGTHHKLALDALAYLNEPDGPRWQRLFMKHAALYVQGSKAPDNEFKDFQNHVLHVRDGYWGGATDKVENWYHHLVKALAGERWSEAAWAAGVLSHYYTDPIHPFHTAQSEAENNIHRACEWSINRSYDALARMAREEMGEIRAAPGEGQAWLRAFVVEGAERSNQYYEKLIAHYDITRGVVEPTEGLDVVGRRIVAELIGYATRGFAALLDRAIREAKVSPPEVSLALDVAGALLLLPKKWIKTRAENSEDRRAVEAMFDELKATGTVEKNLPEDERVLRQAYASDVLVRDLEKREKDRGNVVAMPSRYHRGYWSNGEAYATAAVPAAPAGEIGKPRLVKPAETAPAPAPAPPTISALPAEAEQSRETATTVIQAEFGERLGAQPRVYLQPSDDVERAPSIGPKMAERLYAVGIKTVADLFAADPDKLSLALDHRNVYDETIADWQDQARLVCSVPGLRGTHAQLLVGAGYRSRDAVADAAEDKLCASVLAFAISPEGQRILRDGNPPDIERIKGWLKSAIAAKVA
jgi:predicted flap endonuclease-1-like 5' DNA nuclease